MKKIKLEIIGLSFSQTQTGAYALILGEAEGHRRLPVVIGGFEAQAIAVELENMHPSRPLTHDLFRNFAIEFSISIDEVIVYNLKEGIFYAKLICSNLAGEIKEIDARTSDAIAMAVRFNCPIYTYEFILTSAGVASEENEEGSDDEKPKVLPKKKSEKALPSSGNEYELLNEVELKQALMKALDDEDYETASKIRDELNKRKPASDQ